MRSLFFLPLLFLVFSCSDSLVQIAPGNHTNNTPSTTPGTTKKIEGSSCERNSACLSNICENSVCEAVAMGPACGAIYCAQNMNCLDPISQKCGIGECLEDCQCENAGKTWCPTDEGSGACCEDGDACLFQRCITPGSICDPEDFNSCQRDEFCEPTLNKCIPKSINTTECTYVPPIGKFDPVEAYAWTGSLISPKYDQVMMTPIVANLTDDNGDGKINEDDVPDIVFTSFWASSVSSSYSGRGVLRVIDGATGTEHWSSTGLTIPFEVRASGTPALGDLDGDGIPEIIIEAAPILDDSTGKRRVIPNGIYAISNTGKIIWHNKSARGNGSGGPAIANLDGKGNAEIITGLDVLSAKGDSICRFGTFAYMPTAVDLDDDGLQEIVVGQTAYKLIDATKTDGTGCAPFSVEGFYAYPAVADLNQNGKPEIVNVFAGRLNILDGQFNTILSQDIPIDAARVQTIYNTNCTPKSACTSSKACRETEKNDRCYQGSCRHWACQPGGGPPTIADFDGDGVPEIGIAARWYYIVYEADGTVLWAHKTKDFSSAVTGSSVFDFEGDGKAEVVYNDEAYLRVYSGSGTGSDADGDGFNDPVILLEEENTSGTLYEYPVIVDVDNDGSAEIVVSANDYAYKFDGKDHGSKGIRIFKDAKNRWVGTRKIWNQHAYHVTNINEDGSIPQKESSNWKDSKLNNFRQNVQGGNLANAPNFVASLNIDGQSCAINGMKIKFAIKNTGAIGVRIGALSTTLLGGAAGDLLTPIKTFTNTKPLSPGAIEEIDFNWILPEELYGADVQIEVKTDYDMEGVGRHNECIEDDNSAIQTTLCRAPQ